MTKPGPKRKYHYSLYEASELLRSDSEVVLKVPSVEDYQRDMAHKAGIDKLAPATSFYRIIDSTGAVAEFSGLIATEEPGIARFEEGKLPAFVIEKMVRAVGRESLIEYLKFTDPDVNPDGYPEQLGN